MTVLGKSLRVMSMVAALTLRHSMIDAKESVRWADANGNPPSVELLAGLYRAQWAVELHGLGPFVVTSVFDREGVEDAAPNTIHPKGLAADIRTRHLSADGVGRMWDVLADVLGPGWDVIKESDHIHIEYDPREANKLAAWKGVR